MKRGLTDELASAASVIRAVLPSGSDWAVYDLRIDWLLENDEWTREWSVQWQHISGARGTVTAPTAADLAQTFDATVTQVSGLNLRRKPNRYERKGFLNIKEGPTTLSREGRT